MKKCYFIIGLLILFISCSAVYAEGNDTEIYQEPLPDTDFRTLDYEIQNTPENGTLYLQNNYYLNIQNQEESIFKDGININKNITIDGGNHIIDAKNCARIFNINSDVLIKNVTLTNGYHTGSFNGAGAINLNSGNLYLENSIISNNSAYSTTPVMGAGLQDGGGAICVESGAYASITNCTFINNTVTASANVGGGAIMFKANSNFTVNQCTFINNKAEVGRYLNSYGGAIAELSDNGKITNSYFINNSGNCGESICAFHASIIGNQLINTSIYYKLGADMQLAYNALINTGIIYQNSASTPVIIEYNWYAFNKESSDKSIVADLINDNETIYFTLTRDDCENNIPNPEYLYPRTVQFNGNVKYNIMNTTNAAAINEINEALKYGYIYPVSAIVDDQILDLYLKYVNPNNNVNTNISKSNESYGDVNTGEFKIKGKDNIYHSFYEAINDALSMDDNVTIYVGEGVYTQKWSDTYYNFEYKNYNFSFTSNNKIINIIGAGNNKSIFKGETLGFKINGNSTFRFTNITFKDFKDDIFTFNTTNSNIYFTNCEFKNISAKYAIYLTGENSTLFIDGCYFNNVNKYSFWNNADNSYIIIDSTIFNRADYTYALSKIHREKDYDKHVEKIYHNFNEYYIFKHNFISNDVSEGFDCTPEIYLSNESVKLGDSVDIIADFNYFTNSSGIYKFNSSFIDGFIVYINTDDGLKETNLKNSVACLKYTPTKSGLQTITVKYGDKIAELTLNVLSREKPSFTVKGMETIVAILPNDATGKITFNVNGNKTEKELKKGVANINLAPLKDIKYTVEVSFIGDSKYMPVNKTLIFSPLRNLTYLTIECNDTLLYDDAIIKVQTNVNGNIKLIIDKKEYSNMTKDNIAIFNIKNLKLGKHDILAIYEGDSQYLPEQNVSTINIIKRTPKISSYVKTVLSGENVIMNITLNDDITSEVYIFIKNKVYKADIKNGIGYSNITRLHGGDYNYRIYFNGNDKYIHSEENNVFTVDKLNELHVDIENGDDENMGISKNDALKTINSALEYINTTGTIYIHNGLYSKDDNTKLTITRDVTIIGIDNVTIDGELKNYFFKVNRGVKFNVKNINFKNTCIDAVIISELTNVSIENCRFENGYGSVIINDGNLYLRNTTFYSISYKSTEGLIITNREYTNIYNCTFKNCLIYGYSVLPGIIYNDEGIMYIEKCIFDGNSPKRPDYTIGAYHIYNSGTITVKHNIFINSNYEGNGIERGRVPYVFILSEGTTSHFDLNYFDTNSNPYKSYVNCDVGEYFILNLEPEYSSIQIGEKTNITATLKLDNGSYYKHYELLPDIFVTFNINGNNITKKLINGKATVEFNQSDVKGLYNVSAKLGDCIVLAEVDVGKNNSKMDIKADEICYGENATFYMNVTGNLTHQPTGKISIIIDGEKYTVELTNTTAKYEISGLIPKTYEIIFRYEGDEDYFKSITHFNYTVHKKPINMSLNIPEIYYGETGIIKVTLSENNFSTQAYMFITDKNNQTTRKNVFVKNGTELKLKNYAAGEYNITIQVWENRKYETTNASAIFKVKKYETNLTINTTDIMAGETAYLNVTLTPKGEVAGNAVITINNETKAVYLTGGNNTIRLDNLTAGTYNITIFFPGDKKYANTTATTLLHVNKYPTALNVTVTDDKITVKTTKNATGTVNLYINDKLQKLNLTKGEATFKPNYSKVNNSIFIYYEGDDYYNYSTFNTTYEYMKLASLKGYDTLTYDGEKGTIYVTLTDEKGYGIAGKNITINVNNKNYIKTTDNSGTASLTLTLPIGNYTVTSSFEEKTATNTFTVLKNINMTSVGDLEVYDKERFQYYVKLTDGRNNNIKDAEITFKINGQTYTNKTNSNGIARIFLTLNQGNYTIKATYKTESVTNKINVRENDNYTLTANDLEMYYRDGSAFNVTLKDGNGNTLSGRIITFTLNNNTYQRTTNNNGVASLLINLGSGKYTIKTTYIDRSITNKITVKDYPPVITGEDIEMYYKDGSNYTVTLKDTRGTPLANKEITFNIDGENYTRFTDKDGIASITINLPEGTYTVKATYKNASTTNKITVKDYPPVITGKDIEMYYKDGTNYTVTLKNTKGTPITNVDVTFIIDGETYIRSTDKNGIAKITINLPEGTYTIKATYKNVSTTNKITVKDYAPVITGKDIEMYYRDGTNYTITLKNTKGTALANKIVTFHINNRDYNRTTNSNGEASVTINLPAGTYTIKASYANASTTNKIIVKEYTPIITGKDIEMYYRDGTNYTITLKNTRGDILSDKIVTFNVDGKDYNRTTNSNGEASVTINLPAGTYTIKTTYKNASTTNKITVKDYPPVLTADDLEMYFHDNSTFKATLKNTKGEILTNRKVTFTINNETYTGTTNNQGTASLIINLAPGTYTIKTTYQNISTTNKITIKTNYNLKADDLEMYYKDGSRFTAKLTDKNGNVLTNVNVTFTINGNRYNRLTNLEGIASIAINLNSGNHTVTSRYMEEEITNNIHIKATVEGHNVVKVYRNATQYYAKFTDSKGTLLKNTKITFNINGVFYERTTNEKGTAKLNINLQQGTYILTAMNPKTGEKSSNNITVLPTITENSDLTKYFRNASQYTVKLIKPDGKVVGAGEKVTFNINGVFYERTTNESGIAKLNINLEPKDYIITAEYNGCRVSNKIKVLPTLKANDLTKKYGTQNPFTAKLVDGTGKPQANAKITFNINGVFYERTTNESGIAKLNINLQQGKYIITSSYNGANIANTVTVQA